MLVLTRKAGEEFVIDGGIRITIVHVVGKRVRLGIDAPQDIRIQRAELTSQRDASSTMMTSLAQAD